MWIIIVIAALLVAGWIGLQIKPKAFPPFDQPTTLKRSVSLSDNLPPPVARYFRTAIGTQIPVIESAVLTGSGRLRFMGIPFNARWRFTHNAGRDYRHYIEATIFGCPVIKVNEWFLDGKSRLELPFGIIGQGPKTDSAAALGLWSESIWLPSIWVTDPRVRWEGIDQTRARLIVPAGQQEDSFTVTFDAQSGLIRQLETLRWRDEKASAKIGWTNEILGWQSFHGIQLPSPAGVIWQDQGIAWFTLVVEDVAYNVDVAAYIRARGL